MDPCTSHLDFLAEDPSRPGTAADPIARFKEKDIDSMFLVQVSGGDETGETGADNDYIVAVFDGRGALLNSGGE
jgi:hypothetical protein